jgi:hypothetical protein
MSRSSKYLVALFIAGTSLACDGHEGLHPGGGTGADAGTDAGTDRVSVTGADLVLDQPPATAPSK